MDIYLPKLQYHAEAEWNYRRSVADPAMSRLATLKREHELSVLLQSGPRATRRQALAGWLGERLVQAGQRLGAGPAAART